MIINLQLITPSLLDKLVIDNSVNKKKEREKTEGFNTLCNKKNKKVNNSIKQQKRKCYIVLVVEKSIVFATTTTTATTESLFHLYS